MKKNDKNKKKILKNKDLFISNTDKKDLIRRMEQNEKRFSDDNKKGRN